jgi:hypothetical protein
MYMNQLLAAPMLQRMHASFSSVGSLREVSSTQMMAGGLSAYVADSKFFGELSAYAANCCTPRAPSPDEEDVLYHWDMAAPMTAQTSALSDGGALRCDFDGCDKKFCRKEHLKRHKQT